MRNTISRIMGSNRKIEHYRKRSLAISSGETAPQDPTNGVDLSSELAVDSALAHVAISSNKILGLSPYEVQLMGAMALIDGNIAQMQTGEGKTLVAAIASIVLACGGRSVHLMTVNDYLVTRDTDLLSPLAEHYGQSIGALTEQLSQYERQACYEKSNIIYGTSSAFAFDYLRDGRAYSLENQVQKSALDVAIFDEVDAILIDEARVPMILSGKGNLGSDRLDYFAKKLTDMTVRSCLQSDMGSANEHVSIIREIKKPVIQESGYHWLERVLVEDGLIDSPSELYASNGKSWLSDIENCLQALHCYRNGREYLVKDGKVIIINLSTGRLEDGRRWSDGLHQAIEAKEGVQIKPDSQTQARITMQSFARLYAHISGMTGTAETDRAEFHSTYGLPVVAIPSHRPNQKEVEQDRLYVQESDKLSSVVDDVSNCVSRGQPVLVGVSSLEKGEALSALFNKSGIAHDLLTAKSHEREAEIIANAGVFGAVTIATNMAGRGTDILLGGSFNDSEDKDFERWSADRERVVSQGGLRVIGTERHDSRRIDLQLQGRAGRQGDPGSTAFYLSLEDELFKQVDTRSLHFMFRAMGVNDGSGLSHKSVDRAIERSQGLVQGRHRDQRAGLESVDSTDEGQRKAIMSIRQGWLEASSPKFEMTDLFRLWVGGTCRKHLNGVHIKPSDVLSGIAFDVNEVMGISYDLSDISFSSGDELATESITEGLMDFVSNQVMEEDGDYKARISMLQAIDDGWAEHLETIPHIFRSVQLRSMAQKKPELEYSRESHHYFNGMMDIIVERAITILISNYTRSIEQGLAA
jgi:preprotein translocase subunit SecA